jgi:hypothetical protein
VRRGLVLGGSAKVLVGQQRRDRGLRRTRARDHCLVGPIAPIGMPSAALMSVVPIVSGVAWNNVESNGWIC